MTRRRWIKVFTVVIEMVNVDLEAYAIYRMIKFNSINTVGYDVIDSRLLNFLVKQ